mmetsp:Transcript_21851/g.46345  ORF Transcript_21851/g.46345 Transcript_21851/m.46345 type:complete len:188 (+) Transcript_21851:116-679(+)
MADKISDNPRHVDKEVVDDHFDDEDDDDYDDDDENPPTLFKMSGVDTSLDDNVLEECLTKVLQNKAEKVTITMMEKDFDEKGTIFFLFNDDDSVDVKKETADDINGWNDSEVADFVLKTMREYLEQQPKEDEQPWVSNFGDAAIEVVDWEIDDGLGVDLSELGISEEEAYQLLLDGRNNDGDDDGDK